MKNSFVALAVLGLIAVGCGDSGTGSNSNENANDNQSGCGNGVMEGFEECDDGAVNSDTLPDACRTDCTVAACGDGVTDSEETCDDGQLNSDTEPNACRRDCGAPSCGDGVIDTASGEICDAGDDNSDTVADACRTSCVLAGCGDGIVDTGEVCDDGNVQSADGCAAHCDSDETCGNGVQDVSVGEVCDEGVNNSNEPDTPICRMDCSLRRCGDGIVDGGQGEGCDDANGVGDDGCGASCQVEPHWLCQGVPSTCQCDLFFHGADCSQCVVYVNPDPAVSTRDGTSWATAVASVQAGIDQADALAGPCEVWVVGGTYLIYSGAQTDTLALRSDVAVYGGFVGTETARTQRSWLNNATILDGGSTVKVLHVVTADSVQNATLDGFTIRDGYAQGNGADGRGGGMITTNATVTLQNCVFTANYATGGWPPTWDAAEGGALYNAGSGVSIVNTRFQQNYAQLNGMFDAMSTSSAAVARGGAMANIASTVTVVDSTFLQNQANATTGFFDINMIQATAQAAGGAIYSDDSALTVDHSYFSQNSVYGACDCMLAGSDYACGEVAGGAIDHQGNDLNIANTWIRDNSAIYDATLCNDFGSPTPRFGYGSLFGGGVRSTASSCAMVNTLVTGNLMQGMSNLMTPVIGMAYYVQGGGIRLGTACDLVNSTLFTNDIMDPPIWSFPLWGGLALWVDDQAAMNTNVTNSIIWNTWESIGGLNPQITYSDVEGHPGGLGNIQADPHLDFITGRLQSTSPCIDVADDTAAPATDRDGNPRFDVPNVGSSMADMGAYEYQGP